MKRWLYKKNIDKKAKLIYEYLKRSNPSGEIDCYFSSCRDGLKFGTAIPEIYIDKLIEFRETIPGYEKNVLNCFDFFLGEAGVEEAKTRYEEAEREKSWLERLKNFHWNKLEKHGN